VLTRQKLEPLRRGAETEGAIERGGYVVEEADRGRRRAILVATGSEVPLAQRTAAELRDRGIPCRVVSMPCVERFQEQPEAYRLGVLPRGSRIVVLEAAQTDTWGVLVGADALRIGLNRFGASAPAEMLAKELGFTAEGVAARIAGWLGSQ
jgi:transketolase